MLLVTVQNKKSNRRRQLFTLTLFIFNIFFCQHSPVNAQGIAIETPVVADETDIISGMIVSYDNGDYRLSNAPFDPSMVGVIVDDPAMFLDTDTIADGTGRYILETGETSVLVNGENGTINVGDFITASSSEGIGMRAPFSGVILGIALEEAMFDSGDNETIKEIGVLVGVRSAIQDTQPTSNLLSMLRSSSNSFLISPLSSLRYLLAAIVAIGTFILSFGTFGNISGKGIEALGRNPLARSSIQFGIIVNFVLTFLIMFAGLLLAYLILVI